MGLGLGLFEAFHELPGVDRFGLGEGFGDSGLDELRPVFDVVGCFHHYFVIVNVGRGGGGGSVGGVEAEGSEGGGGEGDHVAVAVDDFAGGAAGGDRQ